jgi:molybdopterin-containing oxidoreductase family membrane subunit
MKERAMPVETTSVMGLFRDEDSAAAAVKELTRIEGGSSQKGAGDWHLERVHSPIPSHKLAHALNPKKSRVGWFTLAGGIIGFFSGFGLASFTALRWSMIVGGKPVVALVPFIIVGFEFTILFAVFGNVIGLISQMGLPRKMRQRYDPHCTGDRFGLLASCPPRHRADLIAFFEARGAEIREFEPQPTNA